MNDDEVIAAAKDVMQAARFASFVTIGDEKPAERPLVHEHLT